MKTHTNLDGTAVQIPEDCELGVCVYIHPRAKIGNGVKIDDFSVICYDVEIGDGCTLGRFVRVSELSKVAPGTVLPNGRWFVRGK